MSDASERAAADSSVGLIFRSIIADIRSGKTLSPEWRELVANDLEDMWFPPSNLKSRNRLQKSAGMAWVYATLIDAETKRLRKDGAKHRGGLSLMAKESVAAQFGLSVDALDKQITRGKAAAIKLGMSLQARLKLQRENALALEQEFERDILRDISTKGQI